MVVPLKLCLQHNYNWLKSREGEGKIYLAWACCFTRPLGIYHYAIDVRSNPAFKSGYTTYLSLLRYTVYVRTTCNDRPLAKCISIVGAEFTHQVTKDTKKLFRA